MISTPTRKKVLVGLLSLSMAAAPFAVAGTAMAADTPATGAAVTSPAPVVSVAIGKDRQEQTVKDVSAKLVDGDYTVGQNGDKKLAADLKVTIADAAKATLFTVSVKDGKPVILDKDGQTVDHVTLKADYLLTVENIGDGFTFTTYVPSQGGETTPDEKPAEAKTFSLADLPANYDGTKVLGIVSESDPAKAPKPVLGTDKDSSTIESKYETVTPGKYKVTYTADESKNQRNTINGGRYLLSHTDENGIFHGDASADQPYEAFSVSASWWKNEGSTTPIYEYEADLTQEGSFLTILGGDNYGSVVLTPESTAPAPNPEQPDNNDNKVPESLKDVTVTVDGTEHKIGDDFTLTAKPTSVTVDKLPDGYTVDNSTRLVKDQPIAGLSDLTQEQQDLVKKLAITSDGAAVSQPGQGVAYLGTDAKKDAKFSYTGATADELKAVGLTAGEPTLVDKDGKTVTDAKDAVAVNITFTAAADANAKAAAKSVTLSARFEKTPDDQLGAWLLNDKAYTDTAVTVLIKDKDGKTAYTRTLSWAAVTPDPNKPGDNNKPGENPDQQTKDAYSFDVNFDGTLAVYASASGTAPAPFVDDRSEIIKPGVYKVTYTMDGQTNEGVNGTFYPTSHVSSVDGKISGQGQIVDADVRDPAAKYLNGPTEVTLEFHESAYAFFVTSKGSGHLHFQLVKELSDGAAVTPNGTVATPDANAAKDKLPQTGVNGGMLLVAAALAVAAGTAAKVMGDRYALRRDED